jgi:hypothetical protein
MKRLISSLFVCMFISFFSCTKETHFNNSESLNQNLFNSNYINTMLQSKTMEEIKQEQQLLSAEDREYFWKTKFSYTIDHDILTAEQKNIVIQIRNFLDSVGMNTLIKNDSIGSRFLENNLSYFSSNFSNKQLYILIEIPYYCSNFSIFKAEEYIDKLELGKSILGIKNCSCRYDLSCWNGVGDYCNSSEIQCSEIKECGFLGTSSCKGRCNQDITNSSKN